MKPYIYKQILFSLIIQLLAVAAAVAQQTVYGYAGAPSPQEQYMLELINRARAYPAAEGIFLSNITDPAIKIAYTYDQVNLTKLKSDFKSYAPKETVI